MNKKEKGGIMISRDVFLRAVFDEAMKTAGDSRSALGTACSAAFDKRGKGCVLLFAFDRRGKFRFETSVVGEFFEHHVRFTETVVEKLAGKADSVAIAFDESVMPHTDFEYAAALCHRLREVLSERGVKLKAAFLINGGDYESII